MKNMYNFVSSKSKGGRRMVAPKGVAFFMPPYIDYAIAAPRPVVETPGRHFTFGASTTRSAAIFLS